MDKYRAQVMDDPYLSKNPIVSWLMSAFLLAFIIIALPLDCILIISDDPSKMTFVLLAILVIGCVFFILLSWAFVASLLFVCFCATTRIVFANWS